MKEMIKIQPIVEENSLQQSNDRYKSPHRSSSEDFLGISKEEKEKIETERAETERFMKMTQEERANQFTRWLLEEEKKFLTQLIERIKTDQKFDMAEIKSMRD